MRKLSIRSSAPPKQVANFLVGASNTGQVQDNVAFLNEKIPIDFDIKLQKKGLIDEQAEIPS